MSKFAMAHALKKRANKMAKGGAVEAEEKGTWHSPAGGSANRAKGAAAMRNQEHQKGVHKSSSIYMPGVSDSGYHQRGGLNSEHIKNKHKENLSELKSMKKPHLYADGGFVHEEEASGMEHMPEEHEVHNEASEIEDADMIARIMKHKRYSKGGMVANDVGVAEADEKPAEYDDLVLDDSLEEHYTGANSGDELGNEQKEEDEKDVIARIMKSRAKKDKNPRPA